MNDSTKEPKMVTKVANIFSLLESLQKLTATTNEKALTIKENFYQRLWRKLTLRVIKGRAVFSIELQTS